MKVEAEGDILVNEDGQIFVDMCLKVDGETVATNTNTKTRRLSRIIAEAVVKAQGGEIIWKTT